MALPERQRYAFTIWGVRDRDSWLRRPPNAGDGSDRPLLFDDEGRPKPAARALVEAFAGR
jgi:endo-1,4-beta-xylanase